MSAYVALLLVHLRFPDAQSLKAKRKELQSVKAQLRGRHGLTVAEVEHQDALAALDAGGRAHGRLARPRSRRPSTASSAGSRRDFPRACAWSGSSPHSTTWGS